MDPDDFQDPLLVSIGGTMATITTLEEAVADLLHASAYLAEDVESVDEMSEAMNIVVPRFLERGEMDLAAAMADVTIDPLTRDRLLIAVAEACIGRNDDDYAMQLVEAIEEEALSAGAYERVALKMVERGDTDRALEIAENLSHPDEIFKSVAMEHYRHGRFEESFSCASMITIPVTRALLAIALARMAHERESPVEFKNQIDNAERYSAQTDLPEEAANILLEIGGLCLEADRGDLAIGRFEKVRDLCEKLSWPHRDNLLGAAATGLFSAGSETLADMALDLVTDKSVLAKTLSAFAAQLRKQGEESSALEALEEAHEILGSQKDKEIRDHRANNSAWRGVAVQFMLTGSAPKALKVIGEIEDDETRTSSASQCALVAADSSDDSDWRLFFNMIGDPIVEGMTLIAIAGTANRKGDSQAVKALVKECSDRLDSIHQPVAACAVSTELFDLQCRIGDPVGAHGSLMHALLVCSSMVNRSSQSIALARLSSKTDANRYALDELASASLKSFIC